MFGLDWQPSKLAPEIQKCLWDRESEGQVVSFRDSSPSSFPVLRRAVCIPAVIQMLVWWDEAWQIFKVDRIRRDKGYLYDRNYVTFKVARHHYKLTTTRHIDEVRSSRWLTGERNDIFFWPCSKAFGVRSKFQQHLNIRSPVQHWTEWTFSCWRLVFMCCMPRLSVPF